MCSKKWFIKVILAIVLQFALSVGAAATGLSTERVSGYGGDFTLQSSEGPVSLEQYRGKVVLMFFGYTSCPNICPIALSEISHVFSKLEVGEQQRVRAIFVSLDPERDTPELLRKYAGYFHPNIVGVTADIEVINQVTKNYGVGYEKKELSSSPIGYVISHTPDILVVNPQGQLMNSRIPPATDLEEVLTYVRKLLNEDPQT